MSILVTGGAGYIGSHTCVQLCAAGYDVVVADNFYNSSPEAIKRVEAITGKRLKLYTADTCDRAAMDEIFKAESIEAVIHFAAYKAVGESVQLPLAYYRNNLTSILTILEAMQAHGVHQIVFSSSATVYGLTDTMPIREDFPLSATSPYGQTKLMTEQILRDAAAADSSLNVAILRYFNPIGAHHSGTIGEDPEGIPNNLSPYITQVAVGKLEKLMIYGDDYETRDGTGERDYIHVMDLADGHIAALKKLHQNCGLVAYNLGTGQGTTVLEMLHAFEKAVGKPIPYQITARRPGDVACSYADPSKAQQELGWKATRTLEQMCEDSWRWQKMNPTGYSK